MTTKLSAEEAALGLLRAYSMWLEAIEDTTPDGMVVLFREEGALSVASVETPPGSCSALLIASVRAARAKGIV